MAAATTVIPQNDSSSPARSMALADTKFSSFRDNSDIGTPSEDEAQDGAEDIQSLVGVSISRAQTRLTSAKTPAVEKARAIEEGGGFFGDQWVGEDFQVDIGKQSGKHEGEPQRPANVETRHSMKEGIRPAVERQQLDAQQQNKVLGHIEGDKMPPSGRSVKNLPPRLPSPWRAIPRTDWISATRHEETRGSLRDTFSEYRRRRSLGQSDHSESHRKLLGISLPKSPSLFTLSLSNLSGFDASADGACKCKTSTRASSTTLLGTDSSRGSTSTILPIFPLPSQSNVPTDTRRMQTPIVDPRLRRVASYESRLLRRTISCASSLGDDSRFEHVSGQVNSRLKAIKDSFQDANFRLPTMPNFNFGTSWTDLHYGADQSRSRQDSVVLSGHRKTLSAKHTPGFVKRVANSSSSEQIPKEQSNSAAFASSHPFFLKALDSLEGDVVVLGGYRGSVLRSAEAPNQQLWAPIKVGLNLRKVDLEVGLEPEDEKNMEKQIIPDGMLTNIGPIDISKRLLKRLRTCEKAKSGKLRVHNYGYDWRLSPHLLSRKLLEFLESLPCNAQNVPWPGRGALVIAHSLGGMITRHAINQRPELVSGVIYAGVPQGCVNILGPLRAGDDVLLSSRVLTAQVNFTIRTSFALLPLDGKCFFDKTTKEEYSVDFFNPDHWAEYALSPCIARPLPPLTQQSSSSGMGSFVGAIAGMFPNIPIIGKRASLNRHDNIESKHETSLRSSEAERTAEGTISGNTGMAVQMNGHPSATTSSDSDSNASNNQSISTAVTLRQDQCMAYLRRTLAEVKRFKQELAFIPELGVTNRYPPIAVIYGKSTPTVYGAKVDGRDGIKRADAYDELAFASGDGVVLAKAAMVPDGYRPVKGGVVASERGHVTLLGDLEAVGRCIEAVVGAREKGIGMGRVLSW